MFRSLVVPLDGSAFGEHALPLALSLARRADATIELVHVHVPLAALFTEQMANVESTFDPRLRAQAQEYLDRTTKRLAAVAPIKVESRLLDGPVVDAVQEHVLSTMAELVVMTTHGRGALSRWWLGSVADELVRRLPVPLLLVRPHAGEVNFSVLMAPRRVLVPLDGSVFAELMLDKAIALGEAAEADYTLLRIVQPFPTTGFDPSGLSVGGTLSEALEQQRREAGDYLDRVARRLRERGLKVQADVVVADHPATAILEAAAQRGCDAIAVTTHARRGFARLMLGSVADKVIRAAPIPVLVYRPPVS
jgi:nucleotide-binding universal stress UspA family protein